MAMGRSAWKEARATLQGLLSCMLTVSLIGVLIQFPFLPSNAEEKIIVEEILNLL